MRYIIDIKGEIDGDYDLIGKYEDAEERWIPVSEIADLPEYEVMACNKHGELMFGFLSGADGRYECESDEELMYDVVAWMKKPKPYKENKHE